MGSISEETMKKQEDQAASFSWWWDSHNRPNQSQWLEATLSELNERTKLMLKIIEEDEDSFAKRLLSQVHRLTDENRIFRSHLGSHKDATTITRQNKPRFSRSKSKGPSFLGRLTGCTGT